MESTEGLRGFIEHLRTQTAPFFLSAKASAPFFEDRALHGMWLAADPLRYALLGILPDITPEQRARVAFLILAEDAAVSRAGAEAAAETEAATGAALCLLPADQALMVFLALRRERVNRKRVSRTVCRFLFDHPAAESLWRCRRPAIIDSLEHALGRDVLRACVRYAGTASPGLPEVAYLRRHALRFAHDPARAIRLLAGLTLGGTGDAAVYRLPAELLRETYLAQPARPATITAADRGAVTSAVTALYRQTPESGLAERFAQGLAALAARSPRFDSGFRVALVLDTSPSMRGYGDREHCLAASAVTLWRLLCRASPEPVAIFGTTPDQAILGSLPALGGATDLATALLDALDMAPDLVLLVTDGYENDQAGDLARVVATLPTVGVSTPVLCCTPVFTAGDDRTLRRPAPKLPETVFWHEDELPTLLRWAWLHTPQGASGMTDWIRTALLPRLKETIGWIQR